MAMATPYKAKRRKNNRLFSKISSVHLHHIAWAIVCVLLLVLLDRVWAYVHTLEQSNGSLRQQLVVRKTVNVSPVTCKPVDQWTPDITKQLSVNTTNGPRDFLVHVPKNFKNDQYYPLVVFYPGKSATASGAEQAYGLDAWPAIIVYPFPTVGLDGHTAWAGAPYSSSADDVGFTAAILEKLINDMCIDKTHIYAAGFSNGGGFASLLSCRVPGRFAAFAVISGAMYLPAGDCRPPRPAPIINIHGDSDPIVPYDGSSVRGLPSVENWTYMRASMEHCRTPKTSHPDAIKIITTWTDCRQKGTVVQNVHIQGGGHAWGLLSNDELWQFLSRFSL